MSHWNAKKGQNSNVFNFRENNFFWKIINSNLGTPQSKTKAYYLCYLLLQVPNISLIFNNTGGPRIGWKYFWHHTIWIRTIRDYCLVFTSNWSTFFNILGAKILVSPFIVESHYLNPPPIRGPTIFRLFFIFNIYMYVSTTYL